MATTTSFELVLWRHAQAAPGLDDLARPLTAKGHRQARKVGRWLDARLPKSARILVSPATRALETAAGLPRRAEILPAIAPEAAVAAVLSALDWPRTGAETWVLVGHQPTLGRLAARLLCNVEADLAINKGALLWLSCPLDGLQPVTLRAAVTPGMAAPRKT